MDDCLFCRIIKGKLPAKIAYQDDLVTAFHDIDPQAPVHILVVPNQHSESLAEMGDADAESLGRVVEVLNKVAEQAGVAASGYRTLVNTGPDANQIVMHTHFHLLAGKPLGPMLSAFID
ncbi:MAG: histidine triad nucleotide-binding protein [Caldilineaceae bacterium SB0666_bin_21]|nr:histidine triad nucleotide-binding protein [Caldilineaceae bacterium SB0666_bin_21]